MTRHPLLMLALVTAALPALPTAAQQSSTGVKQPIAPSLVGDVAGDVRQIRDPHVLEDEGKTYVFYAICGEQGVAGAEITLP
jgi:hypothetical protein